ncbi:Hypothetical predicted protein [Paramuricea clavata]|uniref:Reverse transcriptase domain-containing protein n=1 Tax=Paramuricea clavata TaxID=317549 RepID=A0A6S7ID99_PARCT|nr:Hypothetical predicted protein [Paramuricea clavata]
MQGVEEFLGVNELELKTANGTALPYCGWTEIDFSLLGTNSDYGLKISFLVSEVVLDLPVVGLMDIERAEVEALVAFLQSEKTYDLCNVKTTKQDIVIQPGQSVKIVCYVDVGPLEMRVPVLFEPNPECPWADGLEVPVTLTGVSRGARVSIQVNNPSNRAISKNTNNNTEEPQCNGTEVGVSVDSIGSKEKLMGNQNSDGLPVLDQGKDRHKTAFITPWSLFEWIRIPFGLKNAPGEFQRFMEHCLEGLKEDICIPYLDDIIIFTKTFDEHVEHVHLVIQRLRANGIKLNQESVISFKGKLTIWDRLCQQRDNNPLTYILSTAKLNATGHRWVSELADFTFDIKYWPGCNNQDADALSRMLVDLANYREMCTEEVSSENIKAVITGITARSNTCRRSSGYNDFLTRA